MADFIIASHFIALFIFNPFLKMDGYWFISDWLGMPNLKTKVGMYMSEYLPSLLFNKKNKRNIFSTYPKKTKIIALIYALLSVIFMIFFMSSLLYYGIVISLNFDKEFTERIISLISSSGSQTAKQNINLLIRNAFILIACIRILWLYSKKLIKLIL